MVQLGGAGGFPDHFHDLMSNDSWQDMDYQAHLLEIAVNALFAAEYEADKRECDWRKVQALADVGKLAHSLHKTMRKAGTKAMWEYAEKGE